MFRHLDDPTPRDPSPGDLGAVLARASRRRQARLRALTGVAAATTLVAGVAIGLVVPRPSPAQADMAFSSYLGRLAPGTPVPPTALADVVFFKKTQGVALALHGAQTVLAASTDAGSTWRVVNPDLPTSVPAQLEFPDASHGFLWGGAPTPSGSVPLWVTSDGGRSWVKAAIGPVVSDLSAIEGDVWAVVGTCPLSPASVSHPCPVGVERSSDYGETWMASRTTAPLHEDSSVSISDQDIELARTSHSRAYVLSFEPASSTMSGQLAFTSDNGTSWVTRDDPCPASFSYGQELAASSTADLWLTCSSEGSGGTQAKALYRSDDGGRAWELAAAANSPVLSGGLTAPVSGGLPSTGYVAPYSLGHDNLAVVSSSNAWLFPDRAGVYETTDGGRTWRLAQGLLTQGLVEGGSGNVVFADATHGWVCEIGTGLWRTVDGAHWQLIGS